MANTLFLRLEGPLQSWGEQGRWSIRDTAPEPTKSGVIGLVACSLGYNKDDQIKMLSESLQMGVRTDNPGVRLTDYHTIGGGYPEPMLLKADGKPKISSGRPHTEISYRDYLCNASFLVALIGEPSFIKNLASALINPTWVIFLGRKSCPPVRPVYDGVGDYVDLKTSLTQHKWPIEATSLTAVLECPPSAANAVRRRDQLISRNHRVFHPRYTQTILLSSENDPEEAEE